MSESGRSSLVGSPEARSANFRFGRLVAQISDVVTLLSTEGDILYISPSVERVLGYHPSQRIGRNIFHDTLVHAEDVETKRAFLNDAVSSSETARSEFRLRHADGTYRIIEAAGQRDEELEGVVTTYRDVTEARRAQARQRFLLSASEEFAASLDYEQTLARLAALAVPAVSDWCFVDLRGEDGELRRVVAAHASPEHDDLARRFEALGPSVGSRSVAESRRTLFLPRVTDEILQQTVDDPAYRAAMQSLGIVSSMAIPLTAEGRTLGVMIFFTTRESARTLDESDVAFGEELAGRAALALENALLYRRAELARKRLHDLFMQAPAIVAVTRGEDQVFELANPGLAALLGERDFVGKRAADVIPEAERQGIFALARQVYATGEPFSASAMPVAIQRGGDSSAAEVAYFNFVIQATRDLEGRIDGVMTHAVEVTAEVKARQEVERLAAERKAVLGQMAEGVVFADASGRVSFMNESAGQMYGSRIIGYNVGQMPSTMNLRHLEGPTLTIEDTPLNRALRDGETTVDSDIEVTRQDGTVVVLQRSAAPVVADDGTLLGAVMTIRDVTAERQADAEKEEFLTAAAHDLRTPITAIKGLAQFLVQRSDDGRGELAGPVLQALKRIDAGTSRMSRLVDEMLDVARGNTDKPIELDLEEADLLQIVRDCVTEQQSTTRHHRLQVEANGQEIKGAFDVARLSRAMTNVLANAIRYSPDGGDVTIRVEEPNAAQPQAMISIHDQGLGIPQEDIPRIFDRFYRAGNVSRRISGTGIGLAGVKRIVELHGGTVEIESGEGRGTTVTITLPLVDQAPKADT